MSIIPKIAKIGKNKFITLHMHLENKSKKDISGRIVFVITNPKNKKEKIEEEIMVKDLSKVDKYYSYSIKKNSLVGRYNVDGRFYFGKEKVRSETYKTDFFDVLKE